VANHLTLDQIEYSYAIATVNPRHKYDILLYKVSIYHCIST